MEVIYTGLRRPPSRFRTRRARDVDAIGISILSGAHTHYSRICELLRAEGE